MTHIRRLMTVRPRTVHVGDTIVDAAKLMRGEDAGIAPVVDGDRLIGVITDRDIAVRVIARERDPATTLVEEIATDTLITIDPDQDLAEALRLMTQHHVRQLPVVEDDGTLIGMVAQDDVVRQLDRPLETISE
jgi:CBS domain-containing protein